uniref:HEPN domain-containing protein n=1 Tax=Ignisphaera aggregans TaxID=334771 RepID=A0A7C5TGT3_9CREN
MQEVVVKNIKLLSDWIEKADVFLVNAERHFSEGIYWLTCFEAHQASELYLKSLIITITGSHPYTHDLGELIDVLNAMGFKPSNDVIMSCELLTPHYILSRYPGKHSIKYTIDRGRRCVEYAKKIVEWVKSIADP